MEHYHANLWHGRGLVKNCRLGPKSFSCVICTTETGIFGHAREHEPQVCATLWIKSEITACSAQPASYFSALLFLHLL